MVILIVVAILLCFEPESRRFFEGNEWKVAVAIGLILERELYRFGFYKFLLRFFKATREQEDDSGRIDWYR